MANYNYDPKVYFATLPIDQIGCALYERIDDYYRFLSNNGRAALLQNMYQALNRPALLRGVVASVGQQGEYKFMPTNHLRNLCEHRVNLTITQRPFYEPKAANTDYKSQAQVILARGLLDYYNRSKRMERYNSEATSKAVAYAEAFVYEGWNVTGGEEFAKDPETGSPIMEGDIEFNVLTTFDIVRPIDIKRHDDGMWLCMRQRKNKHIIAADYPELADKILEIPDRRDYDYTRDFIVRDTQETCNDYIDVWTFFHKKCSALPQGRMVEFVREDVILHDGALPYEDIPIHRIAAGEMEGYFFGYTNAFDCLPLQEAYDKLTSGIVTNQATYGVQNIMVPQGSSMDVTKLSEGLNVIYFNKEAGKPEALQLTRTAPEMFTFTEMLVTTMETIMGVNSVARGNPEKSLESGSALALVQSMAVQFAQSLQMSYVQLLEDTGTGCIQLLQRYANTKRVALLAGAANRSYMKEFNADDLALIQRVMVDMGNPMTATVSGRVNLAELMVQGQYIKTPEQLIEVLTSGRFEPIIEGEQAEFMLIRSENEKMQNGLQPLVLRTDNHDLHIKEHKTVLASPEMRENPALLAPTLQHIAEHEMMLQAMMMGQVPPTGQASGSNQQGEQIQQGGSPAGQAATALDASNPVTQEASETNMPQMPQNPMTGQRS